MQFYGHDFTTAVDQHGSPAILSLHLSPIKNSGNTSEEWLYFLQNHETVFLCVTGLIY